MFNFKRLNTYMYHIAWHDGKKTLYSLKRFWWKPDRPPKMILTKEELEFLANSGGRVKKEYVKNLKAKYSVN